jgi:hypothetical protein
MTPWRRHLAAALALVILVAFAALARTITSAAAAPVPVDPHPPADGSGPISPHQSTVPAGYIVVRGRLYYTDRLGDRNHPAAGLRVEVWDRDQKFPATGEKLAQVVTDGAGRFETPPIANADPDGPTGAREGTQDVFLKIFTDGGKVRVLDAASRQPFGWTSYEVNPRDGGPIANVPDGVVGFPTQYIAEGTTNVEALWTFVNLSETARYLGDAAGGDPGALTALWSAGSQDGPRYDPATRELHFRDEDAAFPDVVVQYGAYAILHNIYGTFPEAWQTCLAVVPTDPRKPVDAPCALLHGLATFLALAVQNDPRYETPTLLEIDLDAATAGTAAWSDGDRVPGRVAGAFWDLHEQDGTEETYDKFDATFRDIWDVFAGRRPETLRAWWDGWRALGKNGCAAVGSLYQNTIDYNTPPVIQPIPDVVIDEGETAIVDLKNYVDDADCARDTMVFTLVDAGAPEAGVVLLATNVISITPQADWFGRTTVTVGVSDGLVGVQLDFDVIVQSINDCPSIRPRVPDPAPARYGDPIVLELAGHGQDTEDAPTALRWDVEIDPRYAADLTVLGRGTTTLTFVLEADTAGSYGAIVTLVVRDTDGCAARQAVALFWSGEDNSAPRIHEERFTRAYSAPVNTNINVDLTGVAYDKEDGEAKLEWFVLNAADLNAQVHKVSRQVIDFEPQVGFVGTNVAQLEVQDSGAARVTASITLTWTNRDVLNNQPPQIMRHKLLGRTVGVNAHACYELTDKAVDPDHNQLSLRWYAEADDPRDLFIGAQGTRRLCLTARAGYEGCLFATFIVRDPLDAEDRHDVQTCWRQMGLFLPLVSRTSR